MTNKKDRTERIMKIKSSKEQNEIREKVRRNVIASSYDYNHKHGVKGCDIDKALQLIKALDPAGEPCVPRVGDRIICKGRNGVVYEKGHLDAVPCEESYSNVCTRPYVPFVFINENGVCCSTSGGYWVTVKDAGVFNFKGVTEKDFKAWGHCGPCGDGAFTFTARVNCWEFVSDDIY